MQLILWLFVGALVVRFGCLLLTIAASITAVIVAGRIVRRIDEAPRPAPRRAGSHRRFEPRPKGTAIGRLTRGDPGRGGRSYTPDRYFVLPAGPPLPGEVPEAV